LGTLFAELVIDITTVGVAIGQSWSCRGLFIL
jgi:hypothetical protein